MEIFEIVQVTVSEELMLSDEQKASMPDRKINEDTPMMEIKCRNDLIKVRIIIINFLYWEEKGEGDTVTCQGKIILPAHLCKI